MDAHYNRPIGLIVPQVIVNKSTFMRAEDVYPKNISTSSSSFLTSTEITPPQHGESIVEVAPSSQMRAISSCKPDDILRTICAVMPRMSSLTKFILNSGRKFAFDPATLYSTFETLVSSCHELKEFALSWQTTARFDNDPFGPVGVSPHQRH
jgi:hypothetical protein